MLIHENCLLADYSTLFLSKIGKMSQNFSSAAVVIGALRVNLQHGPVVSMHLHAEWKTVLIQISWLHQKPADLDLQCFQKRINSGSAGQGLN